MINLKLKNDKGGTTNFYFKRPIFFTFSAADFHWPELHKLMEQEGESAKVRQKNIIDNPHIATWFFNKRFEHFFKDVLIKR